MKGIIYVDERNEKSNKYNITIRVGNNRVYRGLSQSPFAAVASGTLKFCDYTDLMPGAMF